MEVLSLRTNSPEFALYCQVQLAALLDAQSPHTRVLAGDPSSLSTWAGQALMVSEAAAPS
jgi:hypothetical protein